MKPVLISLLKNIILIAIVILSIISFWTGFLSWQDLLAAQAVFGLCYIFLSCYEYLNASYKAELPVSRYAYFPYSFFMFKTLRVFFFVSFALMLISSGTKVKFLYPICFIIAITEIVVSFLMYYRRLCFVSIYANYLLFSKTLVFKIFASDIEFIEFRHGIFYIVKKDKKAEDIRLVNIENKDEFVKNFADWIQKNNISINSESKQKLDALFN